MGEPPDSAGPSDTKTFRVYDQEQTLLLPPALDHWLPEAHLTRRIHALVEQSLDLSAILVSYVGKRGFPPYDPRLMLKVLLYGYATSVTSSHKLTRGCEQDVAMRSLTANQTPDHRSIAKFRNWHLKVFEDLFVAAGRSSTWRSVPK